jgi:hypothetical protein
LIFSELQAKKKHVQTQRNRHPHRKKDDGLKEAGEQTNTAPQIFVVANPSFVAGSSLALIANRERAARFLHAESCSTCAS